LSWQRLLKRVQAVARTVDAATPVTHDPVSRAAFAAYSFLKDQCLDSTIVVEALFHHPGLHGSAGWTWSIWL
jgi:hypothetical protein